MSNDHKVCENSFFYFRYHFSFWINFGDFLHYKMDPFDVFNVCMNADFMQDFELDWNET